jgi:hypothetical protein
MLDRISRKSNKLRLKFVCKGNGKDVLYGSYSQEVMGITLRGGLVFDEVIVRLHLNCTARGI